MIAIAAAINHMGSIFICESISACQSIPLVAFQSKAMDSKTRMVGQARLRMAFTRDGLFVVGGTFKFISVRIMPWAPMVLNLGGITSKSLDPAS